ncbi:hypothetical protein Pfo_000495 [Paulownia fortunei]|nr:hypothetical protein Pfo_000495 [Paulownia fortunei]
MRLEDHPLNKRMFDEMKSYVYFAKKLKFLVYKGIEEVERDQYSARKCYEEAIRKSKQKKSKRKKELEEEHSLKVLKRNEAGGPSTEQVHLQSNKELVNIKLIPGDLVKTTRMGTQLSPELANKIAQFLRDNVSQPPNNMYTCIYEAYKRMNLEVGMKLLDTTLFGFGGWVVNPMGQVILPVIMGLDPNRKTRMIKFLVTHSFLAYNIILGRPSLNTFQAVVSTFHITLKFPVDEGIREVEGDQYSARKCYVEAVRKSKQKKYIRKKEPEEEHLLKVLKTDEAGGPFAEQVHVRPNEKLGNIELILGDLAKTTRMGTQLSPELANEIAQFLRDNVSQPPKNIYTCIYEAYKKMNLDVEMQPVETTFFGFGGGVVDPVGQVILPVSLGLERSHKTRMMKFLVADFF